MLLRGGRDELDRLVDRDGAQHEVSRCCAYGHDKTDGPLDGPPSCEPSLTLGRMLGNRSTVLLVDSVGVGAQRCSQGVSDWANLTIIYQNKHKVNGIDLPEPLSPAILRVTRPQRILKSAEAASYGTRL